MITDANNVKSQSRSATQSLNMVHHVVENLCRKYSQQLRLFSKVMAGEESMANESRRRRGRETELIFANYLKDNGWIYAEATSSSAAGTDIKGVIGVDWEMKARADFDPKAAMKQQAKRIKEGVIPIAVLRQNGQGEADIENWPAVVPVKIMIQLLKEAGYQ
jgi:hypothetical protein